MILTFEGIRFGLGLAGGLMLIWGITVVVKTIMRNSEKGGERRNFLEVLRDAFRFPGT